MNLKSTINILVIFLSSLLLTAAIQYFVKWKRQAKEKDLILSILLLTLGIFLVAASFFVFLKSLLDFKF